MFLLLSLVLVGMTAVYGENAIIAPFNSTVSLTCNHGYDVNDLKYVRWIIRERGNHSQEARLGELLRKWGDDISGRAIHGQHPKLVSFDFSTGNLVVSHMGCEDDYSYDCDLRTRKGGGEETAASHDVHLGIPAETPSIKISDSTSSLILPAGEPCTLFTPRAETFIIESTITSRPALNITINSRSINTTCVPGGICANFSEVTCTMKEEFPAEEANNLQVIMAYEDLMTWEFCIGSMVQSTSALKGTSGFQ